MSVQIFNTTEVQDFLRLASGLKQDGGSPRTKQIVHRIAPARRHAITSPPRALSTGHTSGTARSGCGHCAERCSASSRIAGR